MKQAEKASTKTSAPTTPTKRARPGNAAFTLIELIVVVALIALVSVFALPRISTYTRLSLDAAGRELSTVIKEAYNAAVITGRVYRVVYDLKEGVYWAESGPANLLLDTEASIERRNRRMSRARAEEQDKKRVPSFKLDRDITRKKRDLPTGVEFEDVTTDGRDEPVRSGLAYTHIFPHGVAERTLVHLKDNSSNQVSIVISPILARIEVFKRYVDRKDADSL